MAGVEIIASGYTDATFPPTIAILCPMEYNWIQKSEVKRDRAVLQPFETHYIPISKLFATDGAAGKLVKPGK